MKNMINKVNKVTEIFKEVLIIGLGIKKYKEETCIKEINLITKKGIK